MARELGHVHAGWGKSVDHMMFSTPSSWRMATPRLSSMNVK